jgi:hypothetical protein
MHYEAVEMEAGSGQIRSDRRIAIRQPSRIAPDSSG